VELCQKRHIVDLADEVAFSADYGLATRQRPST